MYQQIWQENVTTGHVNIQASCTGLPPVKHKARDLLAVLSQEYFWDFQRLLPSQQDVIDENERGSNCHSIAKTPYL